jgi:tetratricopeptide (TPR) repeat protein
VIHWYGVHLYSTGRPSEAVRWLQRGAQIDPFGTAVSSDYSAALWAAGRYEDALAEVRRGLGLDSLKSDTRFVLGLIHYALGNADSALRAFGDARRYGTGVDVRPYESASLRLRGDTARADSLYRVLRRDREAGRLFAFDLAAAAASAGDRDAALDAIEATFAERHMFVTELSVPCDPVYESIRGDTRFIAALTGAGMQQCR